MLALGLGLGIPFALRGRASAAGGSTYPLDRITARAAGAWSVSRLLSRSMVGKAIVRLRRSIDNAESDFGATALGLLDETAVFNWLSMPPRPLDTMGVTALAAYGLRLLRTNYTSFCIRVRRSSDQAERDFGFTAAGNLDTAALLAWVGSGNAWVVTLFDQSGTGNNLTQTVAAAQPQIVAAGVVILDGTRPAMTFDGVAQFMLSSANVGLTGNPRFTVSLVHSAPAVASNGVFVSFGGNTGAGQAFHYMVSGAGPQYQIGFASNTQLAIVTLNNPTAQASVTMIRNGTLGANWAIWQSGAQLPFTPNNDNAVALVNGPLRVGNWITGGNFAPMKLSELVVFNTDLSVSQLTQLDNSRAAYYRFSYAVSLPRAWVVTAYDHSGNNNHATQTVAAAQPLFVNNGAFVALNSIPSFAPDGIDDMLVFLRPLGVGTVIGVTSAETVSNPSPVLGGPAPQRIEVINGFFGIRGELFNDGFAFTVVNQAPRAWAGSITATQKLAWSNNVSLGVLDRLGDKLTIEAISGRTIVPNTWWSSATVGEIVIFGAPINDSERTLLTADQMRFFAL